MKTQIKTTRRYQCKPIRMAKIQNSTSNAGKDAEQKELLLTVGRTANGYIHLGSLFQN